MQSGKTMNFVKGVGIGMAAGAMATMVGKVVMDNKKSVVKKTGKAVKSLGEVVDNISCFFK